MTRTELERKALAWALRRNLDEASITVDQLSTKIGCDRTTLSRWINASSLPNHHLNTVLEHLKFNSLDSIIALYQISPDYLGQADRLDIVRNIYSFGHSSISDRIHLIASCFGLTSDYKDYSAPNYIELDNYADRDAILQTSIDISRCYPRSDLRFCKCNEFTEQNFDENVVLLGGPSFGEYINNTTADIFVRECNIPIVATDDALVIREKHYRFEKNPDGSVKKDYAVIVRFLNPIRQDKFVIWFLGHFSWGVTAATKCISVTATNEKFVGSRIPLRANSITLFPIYRVLGNCNPDLNHLEVIEF